MKQLKSLVALQLRDKIDFGFLRDKKQLLRTSIFAIIKFVIITIVVYFLLLISKKFIFRESDIPKIIILIISFILFLQLIGCIIELMQNLYFADDNRVLITFPVDTNKIFISKLIVFVIYELKKSLNFLIPFLLGCTLFMSFSFSQKSPWFLSLWMLLPTLVIVIILVLLGALLSIGAMYIRRFFMKSSILEVITLFVILIASIIGIVYLINLIPTNIDLVNQWPTISNNIHTFLLAMEKKLVIMSNLVYTILGEYNSSLLNYQITIISLLKFGLLIITSIILFIVVYFISRPIFFKMMAKNFEINKNNVKDKPNRVYNKYFTFVNKEFIINMRTINISLNYLIIYIIVPILILLLNAVYKAMDTREFGNQLVYMFNILLICLPLLASNALVATYYSREGRAAYIKKTKPILAIYPLFAKLFFNVAFSIPTVFITVAIFGSSVNFNDIEIFTLGLAILFLHLGHMVYSGMLDVMNPQNEQYATTGGTIDNPNERKSTIFAFIISFVYASISYKLLSEASLNQNMFIGVFKLMFISLAYCISMLVMFMKRVKAFYASI